MYPLENQVCTLEQARKFDELGLKLKGYFEWKEHCYTGGETDLIIQCRSGGINSRLIHFYPAYSSAELDVLLPSRCTIDGNICFYQLRKNGYHNEIDPVSYTAGYYPYPASEVIPGIGYTGDNPVHIKGDLLIYILKEKLIAPEDLSL